MGWIPCSGNSSSKAKIKKKKKTQLQENPVDQIKLTSGTLCICCFVSICIIVLSYFFFFFFSFTSSFSTGRPFPSSQLLIQFLSWYGDEVIGLCIWFILSLCYLGSALYGSQAENFEFFSRLRISFIVFLLYCYLIYSVNYYFENFLHIYTDIVLQLDSRWNSLGCASDYGFLQFWIFFVPLNFNLLRCFDYVIVFIASNLV